MMHVLVLDFDGVISDSAPEAFVVAMQAYALEYPGSRLAEELSWLHEGHGVSLERFRGEAIYANFLELMPLGNRAEDYAVILSIIEKGLHIPNQEAYDVQRHDAEPSALHRFHQRFYEIRAQFARSDPEGWRRLISPYPAVLEILRRVAGHVILAIATAKDRSTVQRLLCDYNIDALFRNDCMLDKEVGASKAVHLQRLHDTLGVAYANMTFVDDKVNHLDAVAPLGVRCVLASWGYNGLREQQVAHARDYLVATLDDLEDQLFKYT